MLVITPISWILLHQPNSDPAGASVPIVTRDDDAHATPTSRPITTPPGSNPTSSATPKATPTTSPSGSTTATPATTEPTDRPTNAPTSAPTGGATGGQTTAPTDGPPTATAVPTASTTGPRAQTPPTTTTAPPPPPADDGSMTADELQLFTLIDNARKDCAPLQRDSALTAIARGDARTRAESGSVSADGSSMTAAGGDGWTAKRAFDRMMAQSRSTVLNCGLTTLGVGFGSYQHCKVDLGFCLKTADRNSWVADFT